MPDQDNADLPAPLHALTEKVAARPTQVTDADFAAAKASGARHAGHLDIARELTDGSVGSN